MIWKTFIAIYISSAVVYFFLYLLQSVINSKNNEKIVFNCFCGNLLLVLTPIANTIISLVSIFSCACEFVDYLGGLDLLNKDISIKNIFKK